MDKVFIKLFNKPPDEIIGGDYIYNLPWYEELMAKEIPVVMKMPLEKLREQRKHNWLGGQFKLHWESKTLQRGDYDPFVEPPLNLMCYEEYEFSQINDVLNKIAAEGKPFMDISSSDSFGLLAFIAKMNPHIPCMVTDIERHLIQCLRVFIDRDLSEYNINLASFDNYDIPIKDNSLDYITSTMGISSIGSHNVLNKSFKLTSNKNKPINEVYRILKPGGCFVTIEFNNEFKFDLTKMRETLNRRGKLFGIYTCSEIEELQNKLKAEISWYEQFTAAGFQVEIEEKYPLEKISGYNTRAKLYNLTHTYKTHEWTDDEETEYKQYSSSVNRKVFDDEAEDSGIEFTSGETFYVLRKVII